MKETLYATMGFFSSLKHEKERKGNLRRKFISVIITLVHWITVAYMVWHGQCERDGLQCRLIITELAFKEEITKALERKEYYAN